MRDIGKNIRDLRKRQNMTQDELAARLFVTRQTVSNYENGRTRPDVEQILRLAEIFGTDANAVLYGPPVPESRRRAVFPTLTGIGLTAILWGVMVRLRPWVFACMKRNEYFLPGFCTFCCLEAHCLGYDGLDADPAAEPVHPHPASSDTLHPPGAPGAAGSCTLRYRAAGAVLGFDLQRCL